MQIIRVEGKEQRPKLEVKLDRGEDHETKLENNPEVHNTGSNRRSNQLKTITSKSHTYKSHDHVTFYNISDLFREALIHFPNNQYHLLFINEGEVCQTATLVKKK